MLLFLVINSSEFIVKTFERRISLKHCSLLGKMHACRSQGLRSPISRAEISDLKGWDLRSQGLRSPISRAEISIDETARMLQICSILPIATLGISDLKRWDLRSQGPRSPISRAEISDLKGWGLRSQSLRSDSTRAEIRDARAEIANLNGWDRKSQPLRSALSYFDILKVFFEYTQCLSSTTINDVIRHPIKSLIHELGSFSVSSNNFLCVVASLESNTTLK